MGLEKKQKSAGLIDLGKMPEKGSVEVAKRPAEPYYPSLHIDKDIGLDEADAGKVMKATISFVVRRVSKEVNDKGTKRESAQLDVKGIKITRGE